MDKKIVDYDNDSSKNGQSGDSGDYDSGNRLNSTAVARRATRLRQQKILPPPPELGPKIELSLFSEGEARGGRKKKKNDGYQPGGTPRGKGSWMEPSGRIINKAT